MHLVITGGAGFIGSNFVRYWLRRHPGDTVLVLDALTYAGDRANLSDLEAAAPERIAFVHGDIADRSTVDRVLATRGADVLVNFAAESHNSRAILDPGAFVRTNVLGTQTLLEASRQAGVRRFHHVSTCEVYGDLPLDEGEPFSEMSPYRPRTPYSASKAAADLLVRAYGSTFGLNVTITNTANTYGPWQHPEKLIPLFTTNALDDHPLPLYRHSENRREWLHVDDHCSAIESVIERGRAGETYHAGSGEERSIEATADAILSILGKPAGLKRYVEDRPGHDRRYLLDHSKIARELGWAPRVRYDDGLADAVRWYAAHRDWWRPKKDRLARELDETKWAAAAF